MARAPIDVTFNTDLGIPVDAGLATPTTTNGLVGRVYTYNDVLFRLICVDNAGDPVNFSAATNWRAGFGFVGTGSALCATAAAGINQIADWASMDVSTGHLCAQMDLTSSDLLTAMGTKSQVPMYFELQADKSDGLSWQTILLWQVTCFNTILHPAP